ncbi:UNVERIFIED_CONTAM: hypothetical protein K2H54_060256 [Gekko kuhli]
MGSNLGIRAEDVTNIMVAGTNCKFKEEFYSVSTKVVCKVGEVLEAMKGEIVVDVSGQQGRSTSEVQFTYQFIKKYFVPITVKTLKNSP